MDGVNKVLFAILGLVVVMILFAVVTSRMRVGNTGILSFKRPSILTPAPTVKLGLITPTPASRKGFFSFLNRPTPTPKTTQNSPAQNPTPGQSKGAFSFLGNPKPTTAPTSTPASPATKPAQVGKVQNIPKTGPGLLFPTVIVGLTVGMYLRKRS